MGVAVAADEVGRGGDAGAAIGADGAMAAVVQDDVGGEAVLLVANDVGGEAQGDALGRGLAPVVGDGVPEDRFHAQIACGAQYIGATCAERRAEVADGLAGDLGERVLGAAELLADLGGGSEGEIGVGPGMVADEVAGLVNAADEIGDDLGVAADEEKGGADVAGGQLVEQLRRPSGIRAVVEGEGEIAGALRGAERGTEEARGRPHGGVGVPAEGEAGRSERAEARDEAGFHWREHAAFQCAVAGWGGASRGGLRSPGG